MPAGAHVLAAADLPDGELAVGRSPAVPNPSGEQPSAKAELRIVVKGLRGEAKLQVPGSQSSKLIKSFEHLVLAALAVAALIGTFYGAAAARIPATGTIGLVAGELLLIASVAVIAQRRQRRRRH